ncbi:HET-domain-containing protein [Acephala macrosclerotiorum]|nr:HET-domain-containing protein [Acephala macrosclerotiorum]
MVSGIYSSLASEKSEIRLLTIQPSLISSSPLRCRLRQVPLTDSARYQALSYVWGDQATKYLITINGENFEVGMNLNSALRRLRRKFTKVTLWCDAICINQEDIPERGHQIRRMRDIYGYAQQVIIWLGEEEKESRLALKNIQLWSNMFASSFVEEPASLLNGKSITTLFNPAMWAATSSLFQRRWWRRVWVFQEVVVSRSAVLVCGSNSCSWLALLRARAVWDMLKTPEYLQCLTEDHIGMLSNCDFNVSIPMFVMQANIAQPFGVGLLSLIRLMNRFEATDPRDRLYALLGVYPVMDVEIEPNYEKSVSEVYTDFVSTFLRDKRRLSPLGGAGVGNPRPQPIINLPSWVPDLRNLSMVDEYSSFAAAGPTDAVATISDSRFLSAQGVICGTIEQLEPWVPDDYLGKTTWVELILSQGRSLHPTGIPQIQAYFRTLICDSSKFALCQTDFRGCQETDDFYDLACGFLYILGSLLPQRSQVKLKSRRIPQERLEKLEDFNDYVYTYALWEGVIPSPTSEESILESFLGPIESERRLQWPQITEPKKGSDCRLFFAHAMTNGCKDRSFFLTKEGYMGLVPPGTKENDLLCILSGCELPLVIRPLAGQYLLIGSCYIYGMMHGEIMKDVRDGRLHFQTLQFQ